MESVRQDGNRRGPGSSPPAAPEPICRNDEHDEP